MYNFLCCFFIVCLLFFFFKQKTAYEMRISDWSSDVCSSDLTSAVQKLDGSFPCFAVGRLPEHRALIQLEGAGTPGFQGLEGDFGHVFALGQIGEFKPISVNPAIQYQRVDCSSGSQSPRSEENTSELKSLMRHSYAVICLKKKK